MADAMLLAAAVAAMTFLVLRMLSPPEPLGLVVASGHWTYLGPGFLACDMLR